MSGVRRRGLMVKTKEKGPIVNTYTFTRNVEAYTAGRDNIVDFAFNPNAEYVLVASFTASWTYARLLINGATIGQAWGNPGTISFNNASGTKFNLFIWHPLADGVLTINITETIPRNI